MKILIAIPCGDMLDVNFVDSIIQLAQNRYINIQVDVKLGAGSLVYDARNGLSKMAVDGGYDYILWLDSDMSFEPDLLDRMLASIGDKEFLCAMFFSRRPPFRPTVYEHCDVVKLEDGSTDIKFDVQHPIPDSIFEIAACGFATVLMKTSLVKEIFDKGGLPFSPMLGLGEDLSACVRFRELGHKLYCDPDIFIGHTAHLVIGGKDYRDSWNSTPSVL